MSERFPTNEGKPESIASKKITVIAYLKKQIEIKRASIGSLDKSDKSSKEYYSSTRPLGPIPENVKEDGGSDLSEWQAQVGADAYDREHGSEGRREEMEEHSRDLEYLERDLRDVEAIQEDLDYEGSDTDVRMLESYLAEAKKS